MRQPPASLPGRRPAQRGSAYAVPRAFLLLGSGRGGVRLAACGESSRTLHMWGMVNVHPDLRRRLELHVPSAPEDAGPSADAALELAAIVELARTIHARLRGGSRG